VAALSAIPRWSVEQYLDLERVSPVRHEYVDGYVYALAGGTQAHGVICANLVALLRVAVRGGQCRVYTADVKVRVAERRFLYPDVSVGCDPDDRRDAADWLAAPRVVIEVLSDSTATYDRGDKFALYQQIPALQDYVLVEAQRQWVEVHSRQAAGAWTMRAYGTGSLVALPSLAVDLTVAAVYEDVDVDGT
jgi:Uma2 family endonuclease